MRSLTRILFSLCISSGGFDADGIHELIEIVNDALVEAVQLRTAWPAPPVALNPPGVVGGVVSAIVAVAVLETALTLQMWVKFPGSTIISRWVKVRKSVVRKLPTLVEGFDEWPGLREELGVEWRSNGFSNQKA